MSREKQPKIQEAKRAQWKSEMASTGLKGPFLLTAKRVNVAITAALPGADALGRPDDEGTFIVERVGRSDENMKERLQDHPSLQTIRKRTKAAFEKECDLYHNFMVEMDYIHPARLDGSYWKCSHCSVFD
jgi:hypothetical protein